MHHHKFMSAYKYRNHLYTIGFYNLENLFDTEDDPNTLDDDFTPEGFRHWTGKRYRRKLKKLASAIASIGPDDQGVPHLLGVSELENEAVIRDLLDTGPLGELDMGFLHYDSVDERGIDTALLFQKEYFEVLDSERVVLRVDNLDGMPDRTRDILYVHGKLNGEELHVFVNHWPSRHEGGATTEYKRIKAAETVSGCMRRIRDRYDSPNFVVMGDFNDVPRADSLKLLTSVNGLHNPMTPLATPDQGSLTYKGQWLLFDQILLSTSFLDKRSGTHSFVRAGIDNAYFLTEYDGKYKGSPFRTYGGDDYLGGYSDHFPVFVELQYHP